MADGMVHNVGAGWVHHSEGPAHHLKADSGGNTRGNGALRRRIAAIRAYLPRGNTLDEATFRRRHLLLSWILGLHLPTLFAFGLWQGVDVDHAALEMVVPTACLVLARLAQKRRLAAFFVAAGLVYCSSVLVHLSYGSIEAHFHFFILIGLIALYQDWMPFLWNAVFTVLSHGIGGTFSPDTMYNHYAGQNNPWLWAVIHGVSVLAACIGVLVFWRSTEREQQRNSALATELATAELATAQTEAAQRQTMSQLLVNLARRNQSLLDRQLTLIADLEQREVEPDALADLFQLDHVATRIRRNAESLLVLSGDEPPRRWGQPVPLAEVVRAAAAEVEDYRRVEVLVNEHLEVAGRAVADLAHLLAELIENATMFSPPTSEVRVRSHLAPAETPTYLLSIEDTGIGMSEADRQAANRVLSASSDAGLYGTRLGFHVVSRLARRYGLQVRLAETPGGGVTALVSLPHGLVSVAHRHAAPAPVPASVGPGSGAFPPPPAIGPRQALGATAPATAPPPPPPVPVAPVASGSPASAPPNRHAWAVSGDEPLGASTVFTAPDARGRTAPGMRVTGRHIAPPAPPTLIPHGPPVERPPTPSTTAATPGPAGGSEPATGGSLARRVPGEALAAVREQSAAQAPAADPDDAVAAPADAADDSAAAPGGENGDRARVSEMLSRFQAAQRAARADSETAVESPGNRGAANPAASPEPAGSSEPPEAPEPRAVPPDREDGQ